MFETIRRLLNLPQDRRDLEASRLQVQTARNELSEAHNDLRRSLAVLSDVATRACVDRGLNDLGAALIGRGGETKHE